MGNFNIENIHIGTSTGLSKMSIKKCIKKCIYMYIQFNSIQFIDQLRALKGQQENCTYMNKQYAQ